MPDAKSAMQDDGRGADDTAIGRENTVAPMDPARETVLDLRGLRCPQPVLLAKKALRNIPAGGVLVLECTDPLSVIDIPHFVRQTGHALAGQDVRGALYIFRITKRR
jgi:tRNA 2-thiouridine synthesizing protein A